MADDNVPSTPKPTSPAIQPDAPRPASAEAAVTPSLPAPGGGAAVQPAAHFDLAAFTQDLLRKAYLGVVGAAVGAALGILLFLVLWLLGFLRFSWLAFEVSTAAGVLVGLMFNRFILRTLRLLPKADKAAEAKPSGKSASESQPQADGLREVVETVVFVVVLVLLLKSFAAEAFVIPTGSMAETLWGCQKIVDCPQCGYRFPVNCSQEAEHPDDPRARTVRAFCPNCRRHIVFLPVNTDPAPFTGFDAVKPPPVESGDRVLVAKFSYDLFENLPDRLDVVVFKFPGDKEGSPFPKSGPVENGAPMNYIKRLVGLPGELIAIHDGNLYVLSESNVPEEFKEKLKNLKDKFAKLDQDANPKLLWQATHMHRDDSDAEELFRRGAFTIVHKRPDTMLAVRRIVYDNDHPAKDLAGVLPPRWDGRGEGAGWAADAANGFNLPAPSDDRVHWLGYRHILRSIPNPRRPDDKPVKDVRPKLITDFIGFDTQELGPGGQEPYLGEHWVGDLMLECEVQADKAQGELTLELSQGPVRYRARFDLANGTCKLLSQADKGEEKELASAPTALRGGGTHTVRFANFDNRLTVWVDEALPFGEGVNHDPTKAQGPTDNDLEPARVGLRGTGATVRHLQLWRDTYYTTTTSPSGTADADLSSWKKDAPETTVLYVQPGHFLCLGDNSPASSDSRVWGLVPERLLLGKALMVYFPFERFGRIH
jgi:signal peptidase I